MFPIKAHTDVKGVEEQRVNHYHQKAVQWLNEQSSSLENMNRDPGIENGVLG